MITFKRIQVTSFVAVFIVIMLPCIALIVASYFKGIYFYMSDKSLVAFSHGEFAIIFRHYADAYPMPSVSLKEVRLTDGWTALPPGNLAVGLSGYGGLRFLISVKCTMLVLGFTCFALALSGGHCLAFRCLQMITRQIRRRSRNTIRNTRTKCFKCGYSIVGLENNAKCPECGSDIPC
jgi:hypothetical protein